MANNTGKKPREMNLGTKRDLIELSKKLKAAEATIAHLQTTLAQTTFERDRLTELVERSGPEVERIRDEALSNFRELEERLEELTRPTG